MSAANKKDPDVQGGATEADYFNRAFISADFRKRAKAATALVWAIANCDREDAVV